MPTALGSLLVLGLSRSRCRAAAMPGPPLCHAGPGLAWPLSWSSVVWLPPRVVPLTPPVVHPASEWFRAVQGQKLARRGSRGHAGCGAGPGGRQWCWGLGCGRASPRADVGPAVLTASCRPRLVQGCAVMQVGVARRSAVESPLCYYETPTGTFAVIKYKWKAYI